MTLIIILSFLNNFIGKLYFGVEDNGTASGCYYYWPTYHSTWLTGCFMLKQQTCRCSWLYSELWQRTDISALDSPRLCAGLVLTTKERDLIRISIDRICSTSDPVGIWLVDFVKCCSGSFCYVIQGILEFVAIWTNIHKMHWCIRGRVHNLWGGR